MNEITFKIYNSNKLPLTGIYETPEIMGLRIINFIISGHSTYEYQICFIHELEIIWLYNHLKNLNYNNETKIKKLKSVFQNCDKNNLQYKIFIESIKPEFNFNKDIKILFEKKNGEIKDISSLDLNSSDEDISSWGGMLNFSSKICNIISDLEEKNNECKRN